VCCTGRALAGHISVYRWCCNRAQSTGVLADGDCDGHADGDGDGDCDGHADGDGDGDCDADCDGEDNSLSAIDVPIITKAWRSLMTVCQAFF